MNNVMKKLKSGGGFTLAETLMTVLILVMVAGVVAGGIPAAVTAYSKAVDAANAQVLISTTVNALRGELSTAKDVHFKENDLIYISSATESKTKLYKGIDGAIMVQDFLRYDESGPQTYEESGTQKVVEPRRLVSESAATKKLQVTYESVNWADGQENEVLVFENLDVTKGGASIAEVANLYIRCLGVGMERPDTTA